MSLVLQTNENTRVTAIGLLPIWPNEAKYFRLYASDPIKLDEPLKPFSQVPFSFSLNYKEFSELFVYFMTSCDLFGNDARELVIQTAKHLSFDQDAKKYSFEEDVQVSRFLFSASPATEIKMTNDLVTFTSRLDDRYLQGGKLFPEIEFSDLDIYHLFEIIVGTSLSLGENQDPRNELISAIKGMKIGPGFNKGGLRIWRSEEAALHLRDT